MNHRHLFILYLILWTGCRDHKVDYSSEELAMVQIKPADAMQVVEQKEIEPNDSLETASNLPIGVTLIGTIQRFDDQKRIDEDWYRIDYDGAEPKALRVDVTGITGLDMVLEVRSPTQKKPLAIIHNGKEGEGESIIDWKIEPGKSFYFLVRPSKTTRKMVWNSADPYRVTASVSPIDPTRELEPDDSMEEAMEVLPAVTYYGSVNRYQDVDWYKIAFKDTTERSFFTIELYPVSGVTQRLEIRDISKAVLYQSDAPKNEPLFIPNFGIDKDQPFYYIVIRSVAGRNIVDQYRFIITALEADGPIEHEPNNTEKNASSIGPDNTVKGFIGFDGDEDFYVLKKDKPVTMGIQLSGVPDVDMTLELFNHLGEKVMTLNEEGKGKGESFPASYLPDNRVLFKIRAQQGERNVKDAYTLRLIYRDEQSFEREPNNTTEQATPLGLKSALSGYIYPKGDMDYYLVDLTHAPPNEVVTISLQVQGMPGLLLKAEFLDQSGTLVTQRSPIGQGEVQEIGVSVPSGKYYLKITEDSGASADPLNTYSLILSYISTQ